MLLTTSVPDCAGNPRAARANSAALAAAANDERCFNREGMRMGSFYTAPAHSTARWAATGHDAQREAHGTRQTRARLTGEGPRASATSAVAFPITVSDALSARGLNSSDTPAGQNAGKSTSTVSAAFPALGAADPRPSGVRPTWVLSGTP